MADLYGRMLGNILARGAPAGEFPAFINQTEANVLQSMGGSGRMTPTGVPSYQFDFGYPDMSVSMGFDYAPDPSYPDPDINPGELYDWASGSVDAAPVAAPVADDDLAVALQQQVAQAKEEDDARIAAEFDIRRGRPAEQLPRSALEFGPATLAPFDETTAARIQQAGADREEGFWGRLLPGRFRADYDPVSGRVEEGYGFTGSDVLATILGLGVHPILGGAVSQYARQREDSPYFRVADSFNPRSTAQQDAADPLAAVRNLLPSSVTDFISPQNRQNQLGETVHAGPQIEPDPPEQLPNQALAEALRNVVPVGPIVNTGEGLIPRADSPYFQVSPEMQARLDAVNQYGVDQLRRMGLA